jgi:DNA-binding transcriptional MerR regulator
MAKQTLEDFEFLSKLIVGIGEVSALSGVPARQIRYWEEKDYISSCAGANNKTRRYDYYQIKKILLIKEYMDEGFTLEKAVSKTEVRLQRFNDIFKKLKPSEGE